MTSTIHWPTDHSPITHTDPSDPPRTQPTWPFLHFMTFCSIQTIYFLKPHGTHYPLTHRIDHFPITHSDPSDPPIHGIAWPSESRTVVQHLVIISSSKAVLRKDSSVEDAGSLIMGDNDSASGRKQRGVRWPLATRSRVLDQPLMSGSEMEV